MLKKSQAALEFLTTYAWAFLVILIMIGALAYFGILQPSKIFPDRCNFGVAVGCIDYTVEHDDDVRPAVTNDGNFNIRLKNGVGESITVTDIVLSSETDPAFSCQYNTPDLTGGYAWGTGVLETFSWGPCNNDIIGFLPGEKAKIFVTVSYYLTKSGATFARQVEGEIYTAVVP